MSAERILANFVTEILKNLSLLITQEISLAWGIKDDLKKLQKTVSMILAVIADAEKRQVKEEAVRFWLKNLQDLAYEAVDILDDFSYERFRRDDQLKCNGDKVRNFFSSSNPLKFRFQMASKIKDMNKKFDEIVEQKNKFHLQVIDMGQSSNPMIVDDHVRRGNKETYSFVNVSKIVGRENDEKNILEMLMNAYGSDTDRISVIPIVGMGGLGKTTLAKLLYNADLVKEQFEPRIWVCVSDVFDIKKILRDLLNAIDTEDKYHDISSTQVMVSKLHKNLSEKKYFLVLDDLWNENVGEWTTLKDVLEVGANGSKVIVTTRKSEVASIVRGKLPSYVLHELSEDECWSVFEQTVGEVVNQNMAAIGMEMVKKCKGLPLAITVLGGIMRSRKEEHEWRSIRNNEIWDTLLEDQNSILPILKLSYDHLPSHLKECFSYCAIFPKDFKFKRKNLIQLWMAEGFLQPSKEKSNKIMLEDIGNEYFYSLLRNSLFQDAKKDRFGNVVSCKMHDLLHDLAQAVSQNNDCSHNKTDSVIRTGSGDISRLWLDFDEDNSIVLQALNTNKEKLRTCFARRTRDGIVDINVFGAKGLRVLDFVGWIGVEKLPHSVGKLKHLRYLNLSRNPLKILPGSITILYNLQTLILHRCLHLEMLPSGIGSLKNLRYLDLSYTSTIKVLPESITALTNLQTLDVFGTPIKEFPKDFNKLTQLRHLLNGGGFEATTPEFEATTPEFEATIPEFEATTPRGLGRLACLQTLQQFSVLKDDNNNGGCGIGELEHLNLLRGELKIFNLENVGDGIDAQRANLKGKSNIDELVLEWAYRSDGFENDEVVLDGLQPHSNLKRLEIDYFMGVKLPIWLVSTTTTTRTLPYLQNLVVIKLLRCGRCEQLSGLGQLPSLKEITLVEMNNLEKWEEEETSLRTTTDKQSLKSLFPSLERLSIESCSELKFLPPDLLQSKLHSLEILECPKFQGFVQNEEETSLRTTTDKQSLKSLFPSLERLSIESCSELKFLPPDLLQPKLHSLEILECPKFQGFVQNEEEDEMCCFFDASYLRNRLTSLTILCIDYGEQSKCFPVAVGCLTSLQLLEIKSPNLYISRNKLEISNMADMVALPECVGNLASLEWLIIRNCFQLTVLQSEQVMRCLTSLKLLFIEVSETSCCFPAEGIQHLVSLRELTITASSNHIINSLPQQLQYLTTLRWLILSGFNGVLALPEWLGNLSSLECLRIENCENLMYLPSEGAMKRLTALSILDICGCPLLKKRCTKEIGEEWHKISHIEDVYV